MVKAQATVISALLISGILIALVGVAYMWGVPMIEKQTIITEFRTAKDFLFEVNDAITEIVNTGAGKTALQIPLGHVEVIPNSVDDVNNNSITLELVVGQPLVLNESTIYLGETKADVLREVGTYGAAEPYIATLRAETVAEGYRLTLKLHYRELDTPTKGYKIVLDAGDHLTGNSEITASFERTETIPNGADNGGDLTVTYIKAEVV